MYQDIVDFIEIGCKDWSDLNVLSILDKNTIHIVDNQGYMYLTSITVIKNARKRNLSLTRFFRNNAYTIDNIENYLILNNINHTLKSNQIEKAVSNAIWNCEIHGDFETTWNSVKNGSGCPECGLIKAAKSNRNSYKYVESVFKDKNLKLISKTYINNLEPLEYICNEHKEKGIQIVSFGNLISKECICTFCNKEKFSLMMTKTHEQFLSEVFDVHGKKLSVIGEYSKSRSHIEVKCNECGNIWSTRASHITAGHGCPACCSRSKGEDIVREYLVGKGLIFKEEYRIKECRYKKTLPFDFVVFDKNDTFCLIEFDGRQHYHPHGFGETCVEINNKNLKLQQVRDGIKDKYCNDNNIKLIRIPYWEIKNIENILDTELSVFFNGDLYKKGSELND